MLPSPVWLDQSQGSPTPFHKAKLGPPHLLLVPDWVYQPDAAYEGVGTDHPVYWTKRLSTTGIDKNIVLVYAMKRNLAAIYAEQIKL